MNRILSVFLIMCVLLGSSACGNGGGGQKSLDYNVVTQKFVDALFAGQFEDAKSSVLPDYKDDVSEDINQFSNLYTKYDLQEVKIGAIRGWGPSSTEEDKRVEIGFQYATKGTENWAIGMLYIRVLTKSNLWGVADLELVIPTD